jgi:glycosyltransferase involved in cell wall biosynthesis
MRLTHLTSSTFFGGPERQMLGMADAIRGRADVRFLSFAEAGACEPFLAEVRRRGFRADRVAHDTPHLLAARADLVDLLLAERPDVLLCHGYKANLVGRRAARAAGVPVFAVSRGWTGESWRVRLYEMLDRRELPLFDGVIAVSDAQADKVRSAGVPDDHVHVIRNSARPGAFNPPSPEGRARLAALAPTPGDLLILTAARLSPEKGIHVLIDAAERVVSEFPAARFLVFGDGAERDRLERLIAEAEIGHAFALCGFRSDLDELMPNADVAVLPSFNEGLPNAVLEASAAGVPVVATRVGGSPEAIVDGETGWIVPPGDAPALASAIAALLRDDRLRRRLGANGREFVHSEFSFAAQARAYLDLLGPLAGRGSRFGRHAA